MLVEAKLMADQKQFVDISTSLRLDISIISGTRVASYPGHFLRGRKKQPGTICWRMCQITKNLGNSDTHIYFQCTSIVVFRCKSVYIHVWGYIQWPGCVC